MKKILLAAGLALGLIAPAAAQVNAVPQTGVITGTLPANTYSAISSGLVPAASATDIICLNGSTARNVHLRRVVISGTATTGITTPYILKLNHTLDTGGTAATGLAAPVPAGHNPNNPTSLATLTAYTANPTVTDSSPSYLYASSVSTVPTTNASDPDNDYAGGIENMLLGAWDIPKSGTVTQQICLNLAGATVLGGVLAVTFTWTED